MCIMQGCNRSDATSCCHAFHALVQCGFSLCATWKKAVKTVEICQQYAAEGVPQGVHVFGRARQNGICDLGLLETELPLKWVQHQRTAPIAPCGQSCTVCHVTCPPNFKSPCAVLDCIHNPSPSYTADAHPQAPVPYSHVPDSATAAAISSLGGGGWCETSIPSTKASTSGSVHTQQRSMYTLPWTRAAIMLNICMA